MLIMELQNLKELEETIEYMKTESMERKIHLKSLWNTRQEYIK
jgi:hypothetical protein